MKKFVAILLTLMLVLGIGAAVAEGTETPTTPSKSEAKTFNFKKTYTTTAGAAPATVPAETLAFEVVAKQGNPDNTMITIADHSVNGSTQSIVVSVPSYTMVGKWNYTISEKAGNTKGVTYATTQFDVQVFVAYNEAGTALVSTTSFTTHKAGSETDKVDEIVNNYDLGGLTVKKEVSGNLASKTQKFDIDVTFTSDKPVRSTISGAATINSSDWKESAEGGYTYTTTISLAANEDATFSNIPAGVHYTVVEQAKHAEADVNGSNPSKGYTVEYVGDKGNIAADTTASATVKNTKEKDMDMGVTTENLPYVLLIGFVVLAGAALLIKRKAHNN